MVYSLTRFCAAVLAALTLFVAPSLAASTFATKIAQAKNATVSAALQSPAKPGVTDWAAIHFTIAPNWYTYWRNPGTTGYVTTIDWTLPKGVSAGAIRWPVPQRFADSGIVDYGYKHAVTLLVPLHIAANTKLAGQNATAKISWLLCANMCIPEHATLNVPLDAASGGAQFFKAAFAALPQDFHGDASFSVSRDQVTLRLSNPGAGDLRGVQFFPGTPRATNDAIAPQIERNGDNLKIVLARAKYAEPLKDFSGLLLLGSGRALSVHATPFVPPAQRTGTVTTFWAALALAFLGGLILNLMPCVLPILSMKALALARANEHKAGMRRSALFYSAGVVASFAIGAAALIALKSAGAAVGWGFQLQSPVVVTALGLLMAAIGLNLLGVFEVPLSLAGIGNGLTNGDSARGAFFTGVLAVLVASPCTAPFMGAALGYAMTAPTVAALGVFLALGAGFAAPFAAFAFVPGAASLIPKPGPWMIRFREFLAFPMFATAIWLLWVLDREAGPQGLVIALGIGLAVVFLAWLMRSTASRLRWAALAAGLAGITVLGAHLHAAKPAAIAGEWQPWSPQAVQSARRAGHPVLVDFSAAWCLTCLVNERVALQAPSVQAQLMRDHVVLLKGDWTNRNPAIAAQLARFGRAGVPLYLLYPANAAQPIVLPQILTPDAVSRALAHLS